MSKFTFLIASARPNGNSEKLARVASEALSENSTQWFTLRDLPLDPFEDRRHGELSYSALKGNANTLFEATVDCEHLVFVTPVYWYSVPAPLKLYLDHWSHWMRVEDLQFKERMEGKTLWAISASAGVAEDAEHMFGSLQLCAKFMKMKWGGHLLGNGSAPGDILNDKSALESARKLFNK